MDPFEAVQSEKCELLSRYDEAILDLHAAIYCKAPLSEITKFQRAAVKIRKEVTDKLKANA